MKRKVFVAVLIFMTLILIGSAFADFGGFSGGGSRSSSRSSGHRSSSHLRLSAGNFLRVFLMGLAASFAVILYVGFLTMRDSFSRSRRRAKMRPMKEYYEINPTFYENKIKTFMADLYPKLQAGWQRKSINSLSEYMTEEFFERMNRRLDHYRNNNLTDHTEKISVLSVNLEGWLREDKNDYIMLKLESQIISYVVDDLTCEIKSGDINLPIKMRYEIDLTREAEKFSDDWKIYDMSGVRI